ncbi:ATP-binding cassette domain-containing protein [Desulfothermus okinawensis JCM 13304]
MIEVKDLSKYYNNFLALDKISFQVSNGEIVGLLGPNGAGKTTTLRLLTGYLEPSSGSIKVKGYKVPDDYVEIKSTMGYLPESVPIYKNLMVYEYLTFVGSLRGIEKKQLIKQIKTVATRCQIKEILDKDIGELSKGLLQRVGIASVLIHDPEVLILDEPTTGLDPNQILEIRDLIKEIGTKKTIILSSHILSEVEATCSRVIIINKGKIVADGSPAELKDMYLGKTIIGLSLKNANFEEVQSNFQEIEEVTDINLIGEKDSTLDLELVLKSDVREQIYNVIKERDWTILEFYKKQTSLEKIFKEITTEN